MNKDVDTPKMSNGEEPFIGFPEAFLWFALPGVVTGLVLVGLLEADFDITSLFVSSVFVCVLSLVNSILIITQRYLSMPGNN